MATIGLRDLHYALLTADSSTAVTYGTPVKLSGAIAANVNPNASAATLFADDGPYENATTLGEIEVELNVADIDASHQNTLLGHSYINGVLIKKSTDQPPYVALGYKTLKSNGSYRYTWLLKGKFVAGEQDNNTKGDSIEFTTPTLTGSFVKREFDDVWQIQADDDDSSLTSGYITAWFTAVPTVPTAATSDS
ncbi:MAG: major tail protein [Eubacteriales bacterium]